jgi:CRP-like cAMP-binding protein
MFYSVHLRSLSGGMTVRGDPSSPCVSFMRERVSDCMHCAIRGSALFAKLDQADLDQRLKPIHNGLAKASTVIYRQGDPAEAVFTIRHGVVKLVGQDPDSSPRILRVLGRGAAIGLESVDGGTYAHTAVALRDLNLCRIPRDALLALGTQHPGLLTGLVKKWQEHAYWSERWIGTLCTGKQSTRVSSLICLLAEISGDPLSAVRLPRSSDMADILGCSPAGLSRRMAKLKRKGLLRRVAPWTYSCGPELLAQARLSDPSEA